jgi:hypothetical protein
MEICGAFFRANRVVQDLMIETQTVSFIGEVYTLSQKTYQKQLVHRIKPL